MLTFAVTDTGIGIDPDHLHLIFEEFAQVENPLQSRSKGTGLGLPLCRRLAELLGGRVEVHSRPGVGSTFMLTLPRQFPHPAPASTRDFES
jgi:signal transduction histidine kinase